MAERLPPGRRVVCASVLSLVAALAPAAHACTGKLVRLLPHAGEDRTEPLLGDPAVAAGLERLLGPELSHLRRNLGVAGPVDLISCTLVISGNAPHRGGEEAAIVAVSVYSGAVAAAILSEGRIDVYFDGSETLPGEAYAEAVPLAIKDWLAVVYTKDYFRVHPPANARLLPQRGTRRAK